MKTLTFTKVHEFTSDKGGHVTFYKLSNPVTKAPNPNFDFDKEREYAINRVQDKYTHLVDKEINYIGISDAHTHIERLVFWAVKGRDEDQEDPKYKFLLFTGTQLDGKHTFLTYGGSSKDVHPDEVYLRRIAKANGFKIEIKNNQRIDP